MTPESSIRPAVGADEPLLWEMLFYAANMAADGAAHGLEARLNAYLAPYVAGWGREGDVGVIAQDGAGGLLGAAWARLLPGPEHRFAGVPDDVPELAIAVQPALVGRGIGGALLDALAAQARGRHPAIALSVRESNPAQRLYLRRGFVVVGETVNRVGSRSLVMLRELV